MKRAFALLLAVLMMAGLLAGCGGGEEENPSTEPTTSTEPSTVPTPDGGDDPIAPEEIELPLVEDTYEFVYWLPNNNSFEGFSTYDDNEFYKWMEEQTNVHLRFEHPASGSEREAFQTMVLSNSYPDFIQSIKNYYDGGVDKAIADGVLQRLNEKVDELMPNYRAEVYRTDEIFTQCVSDSGNLWGVHQITETVQCAWAGPGIRQDWLDKAGFTLADVETMDGLEKVLEKFTEYTYENQGPISFSAGALNVAGGFNGAYNVASTKWMSSGIMNKDGVATYSPIEPGFKEYIGKIADWYAKGLVNKNFIADAAYMPAQDRWANSEIGVGEFTYTMGANYAASAATSELMPDPNFHIVGITTPKAYEGQDWEKDVHIRMTHSLVRTGNSMGISTQCTDLDLACRYWDYAWSEDGKIASNWGTRLGEYGDESATYYIDETDANGDGLLECFQPWSTTRYGNVTNFMVKELVLNSPTYTIWRRVWTSLDEEAISFAQTWEKAGNDWMWPEGVTLTKEEGAHASSILAACNTAVDEWTAAVITGAKSVDTYETELIPTLESMNYADAVADYQAALGRYQARAQFLQD